jgi:hypothetical protein
MGVIVVNVSREYESRKDKSRADERRHHCAHGIERLC